MTSPAQTLRIFGGYLIALAAVLIVAPNLLLAAFGMAPVTDVWIRVTGMLAGLLGVYLQSLMRLQHSGQGNA